MSNTSGWTLWIIGLLFALVVGAYGFILSDKTNDIDNNTDGVKANRDTIVAIDKRVAERSFGLDKRLSNIELTTRNIQDDIADIEQNQKDILEILMEMR